MVSYEVTNLDQKPRLEDQLGRLSKEAWPEFLRHASLNNWESLFSTFANFQVLLCDADDKVISVGHTIPFVWDGTVENLPSGIDDVIERALYSFHNQQAPTTLSALAAIVSRNYQKQGLSPLLLRAMKSLAATHGLNALVVPVRPTLKSLYPLNPIDRYVQWKRSDGSPFDPWLRVHLRMGAEILHIASKSMTVTGSVADWEKWTGMGFPESGLYVVRGALQPVIIDCERNTGYYEDPNVWVRHGVKGKGLKVKG